MKNTYLVQLQNSKYFIADQGYTPYEKKATQFSCPMTAVKMAERRSGSIDEPVRLLKREVK